MFGAEGKARGPDNPIMKITDPGGLGKSARGCDPGMDGYVDFS
jgi:hypothetical protein